MRYGRNCRCLSQAGGVIGCRDNIVDGARDELHALWVAGFRVAGRQGEQQGENGGERHNFPCSFLFM